MKKILVFFILLFIPFFVDAAINNNYSTSKKYTDTYITKFDSYRLYIERTTNAYQVPFDYKGHDNLEVASGFELGGFLSLFEFNTSMYKGTSYLLTGQEYWTLTSNSSTKNYYITRTGSNIKNISDKTGSKITEYILPQTKTTGSGTYSDPWVFVKPEFEINVNLENAKIFDTYNYSKVIHQYDIEYVIMPDPNSLFENKEGEFVCNGLADFELINDVLYLSNIESDVSCTIIYTVQNYLANLTVVGGTAPVTNHSIVAFSSTPLAVNPNDGYAFDSYSCTNGQTATYYNKAFTINSISANTDCTITFKNSSKDFPYDPIPEDYVVPYTGKYYVEAYGAQGGGSGGKGGYVSGYIELDKGNVLTIATGGTNGTNGGGSAKNSSCSTGGGASTIKLSGSYILIAAGGGGGSGGTAGGEGNGSGGTSVGSGTGNAGTNGGGGSSSPKYDYDCNCTSTCGGGCSDRETVCDTCPGECKTYYDYVCVEWGPSSGNINDGCGGCAGSSCCCLREETSGCAEYYPSSPCDCTSECVDWYPTYACGCDTCTTSGKPGKGGTSSTSAAFKSVTKSSGQRTGNGQISIKYIGEKGL